MPTDFPQSPTIERETLMKQAGNSVMFFAGVMLLGSAAVAMTYDTIMLDLTAVFLLFLGRHTVVGSRRAAAWSIGVSVFYLVTAIAVAVVAVVDPGRISLGKGPLWPEHLPWLYVTCASVTIWSAVNIGLLLRARQSASA